MYAKHSWYRQEQYGGIRVATSFVIQRTRRRAKVILNKEMKKSYKLQNLEEQCVNKQMNVYHALKKEKQECQP